MRTSLLIQLSILIKGEGDFVLTFCHTIVSMIVSIFSLSNHFVHNVFLPYSFLDAKKCWWTITIKNTEMYLKFLTINIIFSALSISIVNSQQQQLPPNCQITTKTTVICQNVPDTVISLVPLNTTHLSLSEMNHVNGTSLDTELSRLTNLQYLNISENKFIDTIPFKALNNPVSYTHLTLPTIYSV